MDELLLENRRVRETVTVHLQGHQLVARLVHCLMTQFLSLCFLHDFSLPSPPVMEGFDRSVDGFLENVTSIPLPVKILCFHWHMGVGLEYLHSVETPVVNWDFSNRDILVMLSLTILITDWRNSRGGGSRRPIHLARTLTWTPYVLLSPSALKGDVLTGLGSLGSEFVLVELASCLNYPVRVSPSL